MAVLAICTAPNNCDAMRAHNFATERSGIHMNATGASASSERVPPPRRWRHFAARVGNLDRVFAMGVGGMMGDVIYIRRHFAARVGNLDRVFAMGVGGRMVASYYQASLCQGRASRAPENPNEIRAVAPASFDIAPYSIFHTTDVRILIPFRPHSHQSHVEDGIWGRVR